MLAPPAPQQDRNGGAFRIYHPGGYLHSMSIHLTRGGCYTKGGVCHTPPFTEAESMSNDDKQTAQVHIPVEQEAVPFYGRSLVAVRLEDGRIGAVLRWLCEGLGLDTKGQMQRIRRKTALFDSLLMVRVETEGGPQVMPALTLDVLPGWLFGIDENRVKPEARADVILFQRECVRVLAEHFARKAWAALPAPEPASTMLVPSEPLPAQPTVPAPEAPREAWRTY